jgi:hypothetical protein
LRVIVLRGGARVELAALGVVNVLAAEPGYEPGWWRIATADGPGEIRIRANAATGVLDHDFRDPAEPGWTATVPARVGANGRGADFVMTTFQPPELDDEAFDRWLADTATEFNTLKEVLERPLAGADPRVSVPDSAGITTLSSAPSGWAAAGSVSWWLRRLRRFARMHRRTV